MDVQEGDEGEYSRDVHKLIGESGFAGELTEGWRCTQKIQGHQFPARNQGRGVLDAPIGSCCSV